MTNYQIDLRLLSNRKRLEILAIPANLSAYDRRNAEIEIVYKYGSIVEALKGLYILNIEHSCNLHSIIAQFNTL